MESEEKKATVRKDRTLTGTDKIMIGLITAVGLITCVFIFLKILFL